MAKTFKLSITNPAETLPRLITTYGRCCDGEVALVLRPVRGTGALVRVKMDQSSAKWWHCKGPKLTGPETLRGKGTAKQALVLVNLLKRSPGRCTSIKLKGKWSGTLVCDGGKHTLRLVRKIATYAQVEIESHGAHWHCKAIRTEKWFSTEDALTAEQPDLKSAIDWVLGAGRTLMGTACAVRDSIRRAAKDKTYADKHPIKVPKDGVDRTERLGQRKARKSKAVTPKARKTKAVTPKVTNTKAVTPKPKTVTPKTTKAKAVTPKASPPPATYQGPLLVPAAKQYKSIGKNVTRLLVKLGIFEQFAKAKGDLSNAHVCIKNAPYQDLVFEWVFTPDIPGWSNWKLSMAHYTKVGGDRVPDMEVLFKVGGGQLVDHAFISVGRREIPASRNPNLITTWLKNIRHQGFIEAAKKQSSTESTAKGKGSKTQGKGSKASPASVISLPVVSARKAAPKKTATAAAKAVAPARKPKGKTSKVEVDSKMDKQLMDAFSSAIQAALSGVQ